MIRTNVQRCWSSPNRCLIAYKMLIATSFCPNNAKPHVSCSTFSTLWSICREVLQIFTVTVNTLTGAIILCQGTIICLAATINTFSASIILFTGLIFTFIVLNNCFAVQFFFFVACLSYFAVSIYCFLGAVICFRLSMLFYCAEFNFTYLFVLCTCKAKY
jgi:hypothetical protein